MTRDIVYLRNMVVGDKHQASSTRSASSHNLANLAQSSRLPNAPTTRARHPSTSATPTPSINPWSSTARPRSSSHTLQPNAQIATTRPESLAQTHLHNEPPPSNRQRHRDIDAEYGYDQNGFPLSSTPRGLASTPPSPRLQPQNRSVLSFSGSGAASPSRIKVRDLNHIQSFASEEVLTRSRHGSKLSLRARQDGGQQYEISSMPVTDIIEMVAGLLTKITTTNDRQHEHLHRHIPPPDGTTSLSQQDTSVLAFHGKNVPSITILSYLSRIHKYCPTTYEVFLSLLVYFDRMTEMVNNGKFPKFDYSRQQNGKPRSSSVGLTATERAEASMMADLVDSDDDAEATSPSIPQTLPSNADPYNLSHFFVVDSFNIHRLVIAGVTCASKFFSDVFYTNSRYAKVRSLRLTYLFLITPLKKSQVGGLPLVELNHLELQFLLLNDFRLCVPVEELEAYGTMLVEFYAREVMTQHQGNHSHDPSHLAETLYMQIPTAVQT